MRTGRVSRGCLVSLVLLVVLAAAVVVAARRALDPAALGALAEARLSAAFGRPVRIGTLRLSFLPTPAVEGRQIQAGTGTVAPSVSLASIRIVPRLSSVFWRPVVVERVELEGLTLRVLRTADGRWVLPLPAPTAAGGSDGMAVDVGRIVLRDGSLIVIDEGRRQAGAPAPAITQIGAEVALAGGVARLDSLTGKVGSSTLTGQGTASSRDVRLALDWQSLEPADVPLAFGLLGVAPPPGLSIQGPRPLSVQLAIDAGGAITADGRLAASRLALGTLTATSLASPLHLAGNRLELQPLTFALYGGRQRGALRAALAETPVSWSLRSAIDNVDVDQLLSSNTAARHKLSGVGRLEADLRGTTAAPLARTIAGTMTVAVANGALHDFPLLVSLNSAMRLGTRADDRDLRFDALTATVHVANGVMTTNDLTARSGDLTLNAAGTLAFDLALDFTGTARFTRARSDDLVRRAKDLGGLRNPQGEIEVPFTVQGTAATPAFSIQMEKVLERAAAREMKRQLKKWLKIK